ncbi:MAG: hypothetical protein ACLPND_01960 [Candidatus Korobacteraceae bacterium]
MTGSCWRLLAAFLLIFVVTVFSQGQDAVADRTPALVSGSTAAQHPELTDAGQVPEIPHAPLRYPPIPVRIALPQIVRTSGIIFSGRVTFVGRTSTEVAPIFGHGNGFTTITFQVEHGIRGASTGQTLTIHEWAGLWARGERYHVGERVLLFLYSPSRFGLTSSVGGDGARFEIDPVGRIAVGARNVATVASEPLIRGKTSIPYADFAEAVRRAGGEE